MPRPRAQRAFRADGQAVAHPLKPGAELSEWLQRVHAAAPELRDRFALSMVLAVSLSQGGVEPLPDVRSLEAGLRLRLRRLCDGCACLRSPLR